MSIDDNIVPTEERSKFIFSPIFVESIASLGNDYISTLAAESELSWTERKSSIKQIDKLSILTPELSRKEMLLIIRAAHTPSFPVKLVCNNLEFIFEGDLSCK